MKVPVHDGPPTDNVCALIERQAGASPDAIALLDGDTPVTYRSLWDRVLAISALLQSRGVQVDEPVAILPARNRDLVAGMLGIWHAGGAYVPVEADDPAPRNAHILRSAACRLLLTDQAVHTDHGTLADACPDVEIIDLATVIAADGVVEPRYAPPTGMAYILFTSGSTGIPKGVEIEQHSVTHLLRTMRDLLHCTPADCFLASTSIGFDVSVPELFLPLTLGARLLLRPRGLWLTPAELARDIRKHGVSVVETVPSAWATVLGEVADFPRLRVAISTGEAITPFVARQLPLISDAAWNLYGPTETTVWATACRLSRVDTATPPQPAAPSIGFPLGDLSAVVVDDHGSNCPPGTQGELLIGGALLARGYHRQPGLTAERFVYRDGTRFYRTGDIVATEPDGSLTCFGRADDQLKIRGVRIEPGEVESVLQTHPEIRAAAVTWSPTGESSRHVVAAIVPVEGCSPSTAAIIEWASKNLPSQMVPADILAVERLPLTASGKIDRAAIRAFFRDHSTERQEPGTETMSATEAIIADIWCRILERAAVSRDDHFFSVGGDSLAAVKVITRIESALGIRLSIRTFFAAPTLAALAELVDQAREQGATEPDPGFVFEVARVHGSRPVFFSNLDLRMVTHGTWVPPATLYALSSWAQEEIFLRAPTLEALARIQLAAIRKRQPAGPYRLGGYHFGGLLALEMARQLERLGESVEMLLLVHPLAPERADRNEAEPLSGTVSQLPASNRVDQTGPSWRWRCRAWILYQLAHLRGRNRNPLANALLQRNQWPWYWYQSRELARNHVARPFEGPAFLIGNPDAATLGTWKQLLPHLRILSTSSTGIETDAGLDEWRSRLGDAVATVNGTPPSS